MNFLNTLRIQPLAATPFRYSPQCARFISSTPALRDARTSDAKPPSRKPHDIDPRWLSTTKQKIGRCMMFGLTPSQVQEAGDILQQLARDWRELIAGSEGYLTDAKRRGLFRQSVAWGEMDSMGISSFLIITLLEIYAETARVYFMRNVGTHIDPAHKREWVDLVSSRGVGVIMRSLKLDYKFPMTYPDKVTVYHKLAHSPSSPNSSPYAIYLQAVIISETHQRPAARVHEDLVIYDYQQAKKTAMPPFLMEQCKATWELQEQAKKSWRQRILDIENRVRTLEMESWDREDAIEDTGSARK
ncbi:hypothetical protein FE257_002984 [Aspergillus nanangensis]|uniref:Thioesterase/thiol ester dehydrase-isomerase n=1 Tax=Aspergillus nanangensis TaxID=2582783 RepID=A0AAD4CSR0_ASPNN|nr:hypothetical protein FE257_002984 [Aspergillus nanangensis]